MYKCIANRVEFGIKINKFFYFQICFKFSTMDCSFGDMRLKKCPKFLGHPGMSSFGNLVQEIKLLGKRSKVLNAPTIFLTILICEKRKKLGILIWGKDRKSSRKKLLNTYVTKGVHGTPRSFSHISLLLC